MKIADVSRDYLKLDLVKLKQQAGIDSTRDIDTLTPEELGLFSRYAATSEGWAAGTATFSTQNMPEEDRDAIYRSQGITPESQKTPLAAKFTTAADVPKTPDPGAEIDAALIPGKPVAPSEPQRQLTGAGAKP